MSNHSEEHKTKTDHQAIFLFITGKPQREKPRRNEYFSTTIATTSVNIEQNDCVSSWNIFVYIHIYSGLDKI